MSAKGSYGALEKKNLKGRDTLKMNPEMVEAVGATNPDMSHSASAATTTPAAGEKRRAPDRRKRMFYSLLYGSFNPRRRKARRTDARSLRDLDWHP
jgi:hypothetical protein